MARHDTPLPRAVTANPTVPPPEPDPDPVQVVAARLSTWQKAGAAVVAVFLAGVGAWAWFSSYAKTADVQREIKAEHVYTSAVAAEVAGLRDRLVRVETSIDWIKSTLYQVAQSTGAKSVPPPP